MNIAAIDFGSNAVRMLVARVQGESFEPLESIRMPVRLGQDVFQSGQMSGYTMQAAVDSFLHFRAIADRFGVAHLRAVATSAMREAQNGDLLIDRIFRQANIRLEVISGEEEARLIQTGVSRSINLTGKNALLIDIGGGSVEVTLTVGEETLSSEAYPMGTVRLLQRLGANGGQIDTKLLSEYTESARRRIDRELDGKKVEICVGTGGNIEEMGNLRKKLFRRESDNLLQTEELKAIIEKLSDMTVEERMKKLELRADRADVILPAAMVLHMITREAGVKEIHIPGVGLKDGILWDMLPQMQTPRLPRREQILASAARLGQKYQYDAEHAAQVAQLAGRIFDQTLSLHGLDETDRILLQTAALLHDVGHFVNTIDHDKHGYYILTHSPLMGLEPEQQNLVAHLVRFHRKMPEDALRNLSPKDRITVLKLCALLRLADALETSHTARLQDVLLEKNNGTWQMHLRGEGEMILEKWALEKRKSLFQEVFGAPIRVV